MKKFLSKFFIYAVLLVLVAISLDFVFNTALKKSNKFSGEFEVWNDIYDGKLDADIAVYGSSRAYVHVNPEILEDSLNLKVYNFGINGLGFSEQYVRHLEYLKHNKTPKIILLSLDTSSFANKNEYNYEQFLPYMLCNENIKNYTESKKGLQAVSYYLPLMRYVGQEKALKEIERILLNFYKKRKKVRSKGYSGQEMSWNNDLENAKNKKPNFRIKLNAKKVALFEKFIFEMKEKNIQLVFFYAPEYIEGQDFIKNRNSVMAYYNSISKKNNIPFLDYSQHQISYNKSLFYNASHLNKRGSYIFTSEFAKDLKKILK